MQIASFQGYGLPVWGPSQQTKSLLATGTWSHATGQSGDNESVLRIIDLKPSGAVLLSHTLSPTKFSSMDWIDQVDDYGIIAGGMEDGAITLWSASKILEPEINTQQQRQGRGCISAAQIHNGTPVRTLEFNPHKKNLLASGGSEVLIQDITQLKKPTKFKPGEPNFHEGHRITSISWNRVVSHILASASENGKIVVWDLKQSKSIFQFMEPKQTHNNEYDYFNSGENNESEKQADVKETQIIWNPLIPTQFVVANDDDTNPSFNIWDLRNPQYPVATFQNLHQAGVLSVNWCLKDPNLVASTAKDGRAIVTNFKTGNIVLEFATQQVYSSIKWSHHLPGKLATTSSEGETSILSFSRIQSADLSINKISYEDLNKERTTYAPKWLFPKCGARFGFGGKLIQFSGKGLKQITQLVEPSETNMCKLVENFDKELQQALQMSDLSTLLERKARQMNNLNEKLELLAIRSVALGDTQEILKEFGIDQKKITFEVERFLGKQIQKQQEPTQSKKLSVQPVVTENPYAQNLGSMTAESAADFFATLGSKPESSQPAPIVQLKQSPQIVEEANNQKEIHVQETISRNTNWNAGIESMIKKNLMVGNFQYAAECALKSGRTAEAFLIAQIGGESMLKDIQDKYFAQQKDPFLSNILKNLHNKSVRDVVLHETQNIPLDHLATWQEKIAYIYSYIEDRDEREDMIYDLAKSLLAKKEVGPAIICFILSHAVSDVLELWCMRINFQLKSAQNIQQKQQIQFAQFERFVFYKLSIRQAGLNDRDFDGARFQSVISEIAQNLTSNTIYAAIAMKFSALCQGSSKAVTPLALIRDRIYKANQEQFVSNRLQIQIPEQPFEIEKVLPSKQQTQPQRQMPHQQQQQTPQQHQQQHQQNLVQRNWTDEKQVELDHQEILQRQQKIGTNLIANFGYATSTKAQVDKQTQDQQRNQQQKEKQPQPKPQASAGQIRAPRPAMPVMPSPVTQNQQQSNQTYQNPPTVLTQPPVSQQLQPPRQSPIQTGGLGETMIQSPQQVTQDGVIKAAASGPPRHLVQAKPTAPPRPAIRPQLPKLNQQSSSNMNEVQQPQMNTGAPPKMQGPPPTQVQTAQLQGPPPGGSTIRPMARR